MSIQDRMSKLLGEADQPDTVQMDVPLFIRLMEYAREDAKTDMDLHDVAEKAIALSKKGVLTMKDYASLLPEKPKPQNGNNKSKMDKRGKPLLLQKKKV